MRLRSRDDKGERPVRPLSRWLVDIPARIVAVEGRRVVTAERQARSGSGVVGREIIPAGNDHCTTRVSTRGR
jgi:hypothetical protein